MNINQNSSYASSGRVMSRLPGTSALFVLPVWFDSRQTKPNSNNSLKCYMNFLIISICQKINLQDYNLKLDNHLSFEMFNREWKPIGSDKSPPEPLSPGLLPSATITRQGGPAIRTNPTTNLSILQLLERTYGPLQISFGPITPL